MTDEKKTSTKENKNDAKSASGGDDKKGTSKNVAKLVDEIAKLSVMELSDLVNELQDVLGVSAMPVAATAPAAVNAAEAAGDDAAAGGGTVMLTAVKDKIPTIKAIREIDQNVTLPDAKAMTENLPAEIVKDAKPDDAKEAAEKLKAVGATVEIK